MNTNPGIKPVSQEICRTIWKFILRKDPENDCNIVLKWTPEGNDGMEGQKSPGEEPQRINGKS